ncbi:hypothetical protein [Paenibacillus luteus]|uniref:hypothetical protein n=1 Tax=Paenibacillus luteus TaxID=2545753 RepID=UPI00114273F8|nr:hypothetical protein [Paenibacillus luteus]
MSVYHDCKPGDKIYVIQGFVAKSYIDESGLFSSEKSIELDIGDTVQYIDWNDKYTGDNMIRMVSYILYETGELLEAAETFFVTEEVWEELSEYFKTKSGY